MSSPILQLDKSDPGDETMRNYRYQFGYGVILLLKAIRFENTYISLWCEQYEDLICERADGLFECFQIKTSTPENGPLKLTTESIRKSLKRFVALNNQFGNTIMTMTIVSNTNFLETDQIDKLSICPGRFLQVIRDALSTDDLDGSFSKSFSSLREYCECDDDQLFATLKKVDLVTGSSRQSFESDIAHTHIIKVSGCENCTVQTATTITEALISRVFGGSSLRTNNPDVHIHSYFSHNEIHPDLLAKRISVDEASQIVKQHLSNPFRYLTGSGSLIADAGNRDLTKMKKKLEKGGLEDQTITMQRQALAAEKRLLEARPDKQLEMIDQIECVVQTECDEAYLEAKHSNKPMGETMLVDVRKRLRTIAQNNPTTVFHEPYDTLIGFAGLLSSECKVWWSEKFDINQ